MNPVAAYKENAISTQSRGRLVVLLYDGAIKFLRRAQKELAAGHYAAKGECINKATSILNELNACLDMESGGDVSASLRRLYHFMIKHLAEANAQRDPQRIQDVIDCLNDLNEGWKAIAH